MLLRVLAPSVADGFHHTTTKPLAMTLGTADERFFAIPELVSLLLHQADTITLIRCQGVCRTWTNIIKQSQILQKNLFMEPQDYLIDSTTQLEPVTLNPVAEMYFAALLATSEFELPTGGSALRTRPCTYADLALLPWARDGMNMDAPARLAFARSEASWRKMLITRPPIHHLDWWHTWDTAKCAESNIGSDPIMSGDGHGRTYDKPVTLGMLWDIIEARLIRGCSCQMTLFLSGCPMADDPTASELEKSWARLPGSRRGFIATAPRIRMNTHQEWTVLPSMYQRFDMQQESWNVEDELPWTPSTEDERRRYEDWDGNGLVWLNEDCKRDSEESNRRWSRSDDCSGSSLALRISGGGRRSHAAMVRRLATRDRVRDMMRNR